MALDQEEVMEATPMDRLSYHLEKLRESLDLPESYRALNDHDIREAWKALQELKGRTK